MAVSVTSHKLENIQPGMTIEFHGREATVLRVDPIQALIDSVDIVRRFRWVEIAGQNGGSIGFCIIEPSAESPAQIDYRVFLCGVYAAQRGAPCIPPGELKNIDHELTSLWLAGYDMEKSEQRALALNSCA